jgi:hypothetical protein
MPFTEKEINRPKLSEYGFTGNIYNEKLFHGKKLQGILSVEGISEEGIKCVSQKAPKPSMWIKNPLRSAWITDPMLIDCAYQLMILWTCEILHKPSLPSFIASYRQNQTARADNAEIVAHINNSNENSAKADIELKNISGEIFAIMHGYECTADASLAKAFEANSLYTLETAAVS